MYIHSTLIVQKEGKCFDGRPAKNMNSILQREIQESLQYLGGKKKCSYKDILLMKAVKIAEKWVCLTVDSIS